MISKRQRDTGASLAPADLDRDAMEHIYQLSTTLLHPREARVAKAEPTAAPSLPDRERIRQLARMHHRQLVHAKRTDGSQYEVLKVQTEALRQLTMKLAPAQADTFMNVYTEESSAVEREWLANQNGSGVRESLSPTLVTTLTFLMTILAIALAIYYAV